MIDLSRDSLEAYLKETFGPNARLLDYGDIGELDKQGIKSFGYGKPVLLRFELGGVEREGVLSVMKGDKYGHQFYWDRAAILMFQYETSARLERHVKPLGMGYINQSGLHPILAPQEFFIFNEKLEGHDYFLDLVKIPEQGLRDQDVEMTRELARWLSRIHSDKHNDADLYYRRIRDLIGSSECIMGLIDEAYQHPYSHYADIEFMELEKKCVSWRWKLRSYAHRLSAVHGDFHPWNVLVTDAGDFSVLDRSRGEWGEPAGDLACMAVNYMLFGLLNSERSNPTLDGAFLTLFTTLFDEYLDRTDDREILDVIAPFFVFRGLVIGSPEWYPGHPPALRKKLFTFMENVLSSERFDYRDVKGYLED